MIAMRQAVSTKLEKEVGMPRMGQVVVAVLTASLACAGGAAAIGNVTGVSPMLLLRPTSATSTQVLTVANVNSARVTDIAPAVAGADAEPVVSKPTAHQSKPVPHTPSNPRPSRSATAPALVQPKPSASPSPLASASPSQSSGTGSGNDGKSNDDKRGRHEDDGKSESSEDAQDD